MGMATGKVEKLLGVPGEITKLETTLGDLRCYLVDADNRRSLEEAVKRWVRELKDVMYDADDILDLCQLVEDEGYDDARTNPSSGSATPLPRIRSGGRSRHSTGGWMTCQDGAPASSSSPQYVLLLVPVLRSTTDAELDHLSNKPSSLGRRLNKMQGASSICW